MASRPLPRLRRGRHLLGARRHGAHAVPGSPRTRTQETGAREAARDARRVHPRSRRAGVRRAAAAAAARRGGARTAATGSSCSPPGGCSSSGWPTHPVVLVFEDLQWADESLLDFVEYLLEWSRNQRIFVVTLARPELTERRPTWGAGQRASRPSTSSRCRPPRWRSSSRAWSRACPRTSCGRSSTGPKGSRSTRSRRSACSSTAGGRRGRCVVSRCRGDRRARRSPDAAGSDHRAPRRARGAERALVQDAAVLGKTFGSTLLARVAGRPEDEVEALLDVARAQGGAVASGRSALAGARAVRIPAGPRPACRLRHARPSRPEGAPPGGRRADRGGARRRRRAGGDRVTSRGGARGCAGRGRRSGRSRGVQAGCTCWPATAPPVSPPRARLSGSTSRRPPSAKRPRNGPR